MTYDLEVEGYHCFVVNGGICVSNSMDVLKGLVTGGYLRYMGTQKLVEVLGPARPVQVLGE